MLIKGYFYRLDLHTLAAWNRASKKTRALENVGACLCLDSIFRQETACRLRERRPLQAVQVVRGVVALGAVAALGGGRGQHLQQLAELLGVGAVVVLVGFAVHRAASADGG